MKLLFILMTLLSLSACGGKDDDDNDATVAAPPVQAEEEEAERERNRNERERKTCLSQEQKKDITAFLNKLAEGDFTGGEKRRYRNQDGEIVTTLLDSGYSVQKQNDDSWLFRGGFCGTGEEDIQCGDMEWTAEFKNDCFYWTDLKANLHSTSPNKLSFTVKDKEENSSQKETWRISPSGKVTFKQRYSQEGKWFSTSTFEESVIYREE